MSTALLASGIVAAVFFAVTIAIVWLGNWPEQAWHQRLSILGWATLGELASILAVIVSYAIGGPVGRYKASVGRGGASFEAEDRDDPPPSPTVTTTTTVVPAATTGGTP